MKLSVNNFKTVCKEVSITGLENSVTIYPVGGFALMQLKALSEKLNDAQKQLTEIFKVEKGLKPTNKEEFQKADELIKLRQNIEEELNSYQGDAVKFALKYGCKADDEVITYLMENDLVACMEITKEVIDYSSKYNEAKMKEAELAKKNSKK